MKVSIKLIILCFSCLIPNRGKVYAEEIPDSLPLHRVFNYTENTPISDDTIRTSVYVGYYFKTERRNFTLMAIPSMYAISRGKREYAGETLNDIEIYNGSLKKSSKILDVSTIPHNRNAMAVLLKYLVPNIYNKTISDNQILSPFNRYNSGLYRYYVTVLTENRAEIAFRPKRYNTQLISGTAITDINTGRIIRVRFQGEYDMISFRVNALMGKEGQYSLIPKTCDINARFHFLGNRISASYHSIYNTSTELPDSIKNSHDMALMDTLRPIPLTEKMKSLYADSQKPSDKKADTIKTAENRRWDKVLWNIFGDHLINRTRGKFGSQAQGAFRISPILNPLYLSYSKRKGVTYRFKINGSYIFSENREISLAFNAGYSFKQKNLYFNVPLRYTYYKKKNGYIELEIGNGNRITNSSIVDQIKNEPLDSINWREMNLDYFKDMYVKATLNHDFSKTWGIRPGVIFHKRTAVDKSGFELATRPSRYMTFAPSLQLQYRPKGWDGPIISADYERGVKIGKADMNYERFEADVSWKKYFHSLRSLSIRSGGGLYTSRSKNAYFLDYTNFREENIPGGWNDDWTGEYQLLNSNWYNASEYYVRTNITYESPLMILSRIPYVGKLMEMERIYINTLFVEHLHPYIEYGYGFTNRFFSMGLFMATRNQKFDGVGCRFSIELFRDW